MRRRLTILAAVLTLAAPTAFAAQRGLTPWGMAWATGGTSADEREALLADYRDRRLWVVVAARGSGHYLADARVRVADAAGHLAFDVALDGPWLLMDVPLGRYVVQVSFSGATQEREVLVRAGDQHRLAFYFDAPDDPPGIAPASRIPIPPPPVPDPPARAATLAAPTTPMTPAIPAEPATPATPASN